MSFNEYGDRGRFDLLAHHVGAHVLLVIEIKTSIVDLQELLGALDVKRRASVRIAHELGWGRPSVVPVLVAPATQATRRRVAAHAGLFARFSLRGHTALAWLRHPSGHPDGVLLFTQLPDSNGVSGRQHVRRRVRVTAADSSVNAPRRASAVGA